MNEQVSEARGRTASFFEWINGHVKMITIGMVLLTVVAVPLAASRSEEDPNFAPSGAIYDTEDLVDERFVNSSPIESALFIVEATKGGDALTRDVLFEFKQNSAFDCGCFSPNIEQAPVPVTEPFVGFRR